jgi:ankyrin repeat protein
MAAKDVNVQRDLIVAIFRGRIEDVRKAIKDGADVNGAGFGANTSWENPLLWAIQWKQEDIALFLIEQGATVTVARYNDNRTPLHLAAQNQKERLIRSLILNGADINALDSDDFTPLHLAAENEGPAMAILIAYGAQENVRNSAGKTAAELNAERIQRGIAPRNIVSPAFFARVFVDMGPLTPAEIAELNRNKLYASMRCGG